MEKEYNPFTDKNIACEWIASVEGERDSYRDQYLYPALKAWIAKNGINSVLEVGSGQGICSQNLGPTVKEYLGVEPSVYLVERAEELYASPTVKFIIGSAYDLPVMMRSRSAIFSINVLFHLENIQRAMFEISRALVPGGKYFHITANPNSFDQWLSFFEQPTVSDKKVMGKQAIPVNPLSMNVFNNHSLNDLMSAQTSAGLTIVSISPLVGTEMNGVPLFVEISGYKK